MSQADRRAPMASAPFRYTAEGEVDWGNMWDTFCELALDGGPPHRASLLEAQPPANSDDPRYQAVIAELCRGITAVSGLDAAAGPPGWVRITCETPQQAGWLAGAIIAENVAASAEGTGLYVPAGPEYSLKGEIKNVITAVAKTTHYWREHLPAPVKQALAIANGISRLGARLRKRRE